MILFIHMESTKITISNANLSGNTEFLNEYFIPDLTSIRGQVEITLVPLNVIIPQDMTSMLLTD